MANTRLETLTGAARNSWIALSEDETVIVGRGKTLEEAVTQAKQNGVEEPVVVWSPKTWHYAVY